MNNYVNILGIEINVSNKEGILDKIEKYVKKARIKGQKPLIIFTPNPEIIIFAKNQPSFKKIVNSAQINIPDGIGLVWAANFLGYPLKERITGADLIKNLVFLAEKQNATVGLIGGFDNLANDALECLKKDFPKLNGWAESGPAVELRIKNQELRIDYGDWDINKFIKRVKERKTKMLFVGFGYPKQELFIKEIAKKLDNIVLMAVGGTFNYLSGRMPRAPKIIQELGFEWFYRLIREPWRIKRQLALPEFMVRILIQKLAKIPVWTGYSLY